MQIDKDSWFNTVRTISKKIVDDNYCHEISLFDTFWQAFSFKIQEALNTNPSGPLTLNAVGQVTTDISFAKGYAVDLVTPVVLPTVAEILRQLQIKKIPKDKLENLISATSTHFGATPSLTACLLRNLPTLCHELRNCDLTADEAIVAQAPEPSYRIWTNGEETIVKSISTYEKNKNKYLFWIDLDEQTKPPLSPQSTKLLRYLVENLGNRKSTEDILNDVFDDDVKQTDEYDINKINQQLTKLHKYSGKKFRQHLFAEWTEIGLGLKDSFRDKYFLFCRTSGYALKA